jgi:ligand-binding SRPBCC domain-containing protein
MGIHILRKKQVIKASIAAAWDFFSDPRNLATITPRELDFVVISDVPERVYPGLMIEYRVRPIFGIPARWLTEITHVERGRYFVDEQRIGPYKVWHHEHHFRDLGDGRVELSDIVTYVPPLGILGELVHPFLIAPQLEKIFAFREQAMTERFGE